MHCGLLLDVVVLQSVVFLQLLASKDQMLLIRGGCLVHPGSHLDVFDGVTGRLLRVDGLAHQGLHKDLHCGI